MSKNAHDHIVASIRYACTPTVPYEAADILGLLEAAEHSTRDAFGGVRFVGEVAGEYWAVHVEAPIGPAPDWSAWTTGL